MSKNNNNKTKKTTPGQRASKTVQQIGDIVQDAARAKGREKTGQAVGKIVAGAKGGTLKSTALGLMSSVPDWIFSGLYHGGAKVVDYFFNHPEWLTHGHLNEALPVGLNFAFNKTKPIPNVPGQVMRSPSLVENVRIAIGTYAPEDTTSPIPNEMERLRLILASNSGRLSNYNRIDLLNYVYNTRTMTALIAQTISMFEAYAHIDPSDASVPGTILNAYHVDDTPGADFSSVRDRLRLIIHNFYNTFPIFGDIMDRTRWMFSNIFADYEGPKPSYYVPALDLVDFKFPTETYKVTISAFNNTAGASSWEQILDTLSNVMIKFRQAYASEDMIADLIRVIGFDKSNTFAQEFLARISEPIPMLHIITDTYMLKQLQNSRSISYQVAWSLADGTANFQTSVVSKFNDPSGAIEFRAVLSSTGMEDNPFELTPSQYDDIADELKQTFNATPVNADGVDLSNRGELQSIVQMIANFNVISQDIGGSSNVTPRLYTTSYGADVITNRQIWWYQYNRANEISVATEYIPNVLFVVASADENEDELLLSALSKASAMSNMDYGHMLLVSYINDPSTTGPFLDTQRIFTFFDFALYANPDAFTIEAIHAINQSSLYDVDTEVRRPASTIASNVIGK